MIELAIKEQITNLLNNKFIVGLIKNKRYDVDSHTWVELEGNLNFTLGWENDSLVLYIKDVKPKVTAKRILKFQGRLSKISVNKEHIVLALDDLPDQTITLT